MGILWLFYTHLRVARVPDDALHSEHCHLSSMISMSLHEAGECRTGQVLWRWLPGAAAWPSCCRNSASSVACRFCACTAREPLQQVLIDVDHI